MTHDLESYARELAGNHRSFDSFAWYERPEDDENWCLVYTHNRDSCVLDRCNAEVIDEELDCEEFSNDVVAENNNHWAVGWVAGYAIRVYNSDGAITPAFRKWFELQSSMEDYPVLNEEKYSEMEYNEYLESWDSWARRDFQRELARRFDDYPHIFDVIDELDSDVIDELRDSVADTLGELYYDESSGIWINVSGLVNAVSDDVLLALARANRPKRTHTLIYSQFDPRQQFLF